MGIISRRVQARTPRVRTEPWWRVVEALTCPSCGAEAEVCWGEVPVCPACGYSSPFPAGGFTKEPLERPGFGEIVGEGLTEEGNALPEAPSSVSVGRDRGDAARASRRASSSKEGVGVAEILGGGGGAVLGTITGGLLAILGLGAGVVALALIFQGLIVAPELTMSVVVIGGSILAVFFVGGLLVEAVDTLSWLFRGGP